MNCSCCVHDKHRHDNIAGVLNLFTFTFQYIETATQAIDIEPEFYKKNYYYLFCLCERIPFQMN